MEVPIARSVLPLLSVAGVFLGSSLLIHLPAWTAGLIPAQDDLSVFYFPLLVATSRALANGAIPLWTPDIFGGYPLFADGEAGALYPIHLLLLPRLPPETSLVALRVLHSVLACFFMYALTRALGVRVLGSTIAGLVYAYSGFASGQSVHPNVYHAIVWLPLEVAFVERAFLASGATRCRYAMLAGAAFGIQGLTVHIHITLLSGLLVSAFVAYRGLCEIVAPPRDGDVPPPAEIRPHPNPLPEGEGTSRGLVPRVRAGISAVAVLAIVGLVGAALSAVQLLPLYELGQQTYRSQGLDPATAAMNSIWVGDFLTLLLPRLYDIALSAGGYWGPWVKWETVLYVGLLPLLLGLLGLVVRGGRHRLFFGGVAVLSLLFAMGPGSPVPLWARLHDLPAFEVLRSPGRFSLTFSLAIAVLSAYGVDWLAHRPRASLRAAAVVALVASLAVAGAAVGLQVASAVLRSGSAQATSVLMDYLRVPGVPPALGGTPLTAERVASLAAAALSLERSTTRWQLAMLGAAFVPILLWLLGSRFRFLGAGVALGVVVADLGMVAYTFHPYAPIAGLRPDVPAVLTQSGGLYRVFTPPSAEPKTAWAEPNRLLIPGIQEAGGYSSLVPDRHLAYSWAVEYADNDLLDLWNVRYVVRRELPELLPSAGLTSFHPEGPLFSGRQGTPGGGGTLLPDGNPARVDEVRIVAGLWDALDLADDVVVARIVLRAADGERRSLELQAGRDVADMALDMPGRPHPNPLPEGEGHGHSRPEVAFQYQREDLAGPRYGEQLYYARLPVAPPMVAVRDVTIENAVRRGGLEVYGVGLLDAEAGEVTQARDKQKYRLVYRDDQVRIYENNLAMPRAFLVNHAVVVPPGGDALTAMLEGPFDPRRTVVLEESLPPGVSISTSPVGTSGLPPAGGSQRPEASSGDARIVSYRDREVSVRVSTDRDAILVLSDTFLPGWHATIDDRPTPVLRADYLFRGIVVPAGTHLVELVYAPFSVTTGLTLTLGAVFVILGVVLVHAGLLVRRQLAPTLVPRAGAASGSSRVPEVP